MSWTCNVDNKVASNTGEVKIVPWQYIPSRVLLQSLVVITRCFPLKNNQDL